MSFPAPAPRRRMMGKHEHVWTTDRHSGVEYCGSLSCRIYKFAYLNEQLEKKLAEALERESSVNAELERKTKFYVKATRDLMNVIDEMIAHEEVE